MSIDKMQLFLTENHYQGVFRNRHSSGGRVFFYISHNPSSNCFDDVSFIHPEIDFIGKKIGTQTCINLL